jgi:hypothetical protein
VAGETALHRRLVFFLTRLYYTPPLDHASHIKVRAVQVTGIVKATDLETTAP